MANPIDKEPGDISDDEFETYQTCYDWIKVFTLVKQLFKEGKKKMIADAFISGFPNLKITEEEWTAFLHDRALYEDGKDVLLYVLNHLQNDSSVQVQEKANFVALMLLCPSLGDIENASKELQRKLTEKDSLLIVTTEALERSLQAQINVRGSRIETEMKKLKEKQGKELEKECRLLRGEISESSKEMTSRFAARDTKINKLQETERVLKTKVNRLEESNKKLQNDFKDIERTRKEEFENLEAKIERLQEMLNVRAKR